ncbi:MAG: phosphatase PAP2 family protein [Dermatophilaceae bacterium]
MRQVGVPLVVLVGTWLVLAASPWGRTLDLAAYAGRFDAGQRLNLVNSAVLNVISGTTALLGILTLAVVGVSTRKVAIAARAIGAVLVAVVGAEILKLALPHAGLVDPVWTWVGGGSFPSGHTTIAASMSLAVLGISSTTWRRRLAGPLLAWTVLTAAATIAMGWHRPSDVLGGLAMAALGYRLMHARDPHHAPLRDCLPLAGWLACATDWVRPALWWIVATTAVVWGAASGRRGVESLADSSVAYYVSALGIIAVGAVLTFTSSGHLVHAGRHLGRTSPRIT